jgi:radical SAM superfamily enzyme YgiQ (UPF0313 family)
LYHRDGSATAERVIQDVSDLVKRYGIKHIEFQDDNFFASQTRAKLILKGILSRGLVISWTGQARFDNLVRFDEELLGLIKKSGCKCLYVSGESGSEKVLEVMGGSRDQMDEISDNYDVPQVHIYGRAPKALET